MREPPDYYPAVSMLEIERVGGAVARHGDRFLARAFTEGELSYCLPRAARDQHLACRLAAKFAVRAAFRAAGLSPPPLRAIEVRRDSWGKPYIDGPSLTSGVSILLSLSHSRRDAVASVIVAMDEGEE